MPTCAAWCNNIPDDTVGDVMNLELSGRVALVTGSSRGIGAGIALALADEGCDLILTGRDNAALASVADSIRAKGRRASICTADLRDFNAASALVELVRKDFGRLDILVNCAGATKRGDFLELSDEDWADGFALKFFAHVRLSRQLWKFLKRVVGQSSSLVAPAAAFLTQISPSEAPSMRRKQRSVRPLLISENLTASRSTRFISVISIQIDWCGV